MIAMPKANATGTRNKTNDMKPPTKIRQAISAERIMIQVSLVSEIDRPGQLAKTETPQTQPT